MSERENTSPSKSLLCRFTSPHSLKYENPMVVPHLSNFRLSFLYLDSLENPLMSVSRFHVDVWFNIFCCEGSRGETNVDARMEKAG
jgi:hypothetical protein